MIYLRFINDNQYTVFSFGKVDNIEELIKLIKDKGLKVQTGITEEVLLLCFILWRYNMHKKIKGDYAVQIWNEKKKEFIRLVDDKYVISNKFGVYESEGEKI